MLSKKITRLLPIAMAVSLGSQASAWEATRPPALHNIDWSKYWTKKITSPQDDIPIGFGGSLSRRVVAYPYSDGASLGQGWDFITNSKKMSSCIDFKAESDLYQEASLDLRESVDIQTLDLSLNLSMSAKGGADLEIFSAGGETKASFDTKYHTKSTDEVLVAHASVANGATFVTPVDKRTTPPRPSTKPEKPKAGQNPQAPAQPADPASKDAAPKDATSKDAASEQTVPAESPRLVPGKTPTPGVSSNLNLQIHPTLAKLSPQDFRQTCGDGFIASIVSGADLYVMYYFREVDREFKLKIEYHAKANASFELFDAEAKTDLNSAVEETSKKKRLNIHLVQAGGVIAQLPVKIEHVRDRIGSLPTEAITGPRPIFMVIVPYSELPNWNPPIMNVPDLREQLVQYLKRLYSVYFEYLNIRENYRRDTDSLAGSDVNKNPLYLFDDEHGLRTEDIDAVGDQLHAEIQYIRTELPKSLGSKACQAVVYIPNKDGSAPGLTKKNGDCEQTLRDALQKGHVDLDDYKYLVRFPLPINAIPKTAIDILSAKSQPLRARRVLYQALLYRHWVERLSQLRCRLFFECLTQTQRKQKWDMIVATFPRSTYSSSTFSVDSVPPNWPKELTHQNTWWPLKQSTDADIEAFAATSVDADKKNANLTDSEKTKMVGELADLLKSAKLAADVVQSRNYDALPDPVRGVARDFGLRIP
jgi:hypothetical protein